MPLTTPPHRSSPLSRATSRGLSQDVAREECKATVVATNSPFAEWDKTFGDPRLCAAITDPITFRCTLIQTGPESYRFRITEAERRG